MTKLSRDDLGRTHVVTETKKGFWKGLCGASTGPPEYESSVDLRRIGALLSAMDTGCGKCLRLCVPPERRQGVKIDV